ncbi:Adenosine receptor A2b [Holothuria leucospilota]|uniref:Adenosine receptor A2b n=1 Tax=Holothuria leucospilota TaxID=206669 RepID=A0A9Q1CC81_HOLLE|nr:Adenosine receptor A2b [Holothuria leucospilota]
MDPKNYTQAELRIDLLPFSFYLLAHVLAVIFIVFGNVGVVFTTFSKSFVRTPNNIFLCSLAVADIFTGLFAVPSAVFVRVLISPLTCYAGFRQLFFAPAFMFCAVSIGHLVVITVDRLIAVSSPLKYPLIMETRKCKYILTPVWVIGLVLGMLPSYGGTKYPYQWVCGTVNYDAKVVTIHSLLISGFIPTVSIILLGLYARIFVISYNHVKSISERRRVGMDESKVQHLESKSRMRATVTAVLVVAVFSICWLPLSVKMFVEAFVDPPERIQFIYQTATEFLAYLNSGMNPIIYTLRSKKYRGVFKQSKTLLCPQFCRRGNSTNTSGPGKSHQHRPNPSQTRELSLSTQTSSFR